MNVIIARPREADLEELRQLFTITINDAFKREGIDEKYADEIPEEIDFQLRTLKRDFATGGKDEHFLIARVEEKIVGSAAYGITTGGVMRAFGMSAPTTPELKCGYVLPQYQGNGIGGLLIDRCIELLVDKGEQEFLVECGYQIAQAIWKKKFGEPAVVMKNKFGEGADLLFWRCTISDLLRN